MINLSDKSQCCGCEACRTICPKHCITMQEDFEGFLYPKVNKDTCIDCGLCEKVCPILNPVNNDAEPEVYAAINNDENIRMQSSSGGIFTLLAERVINNGGVVFGACFDKDWNVVHDYTETIDGLSRFRGSKYVQSRIGDSFQKAKSFLDEGREVLFSGTPCQIAGFKNFLKKPYDNLLSVEVVCHGAPSPKVWRKYISAMPEIQHVSFRSKVKGWKNFSLSFRLKDGTIEETEFYKNPYMNVFLSNLSLRPSCYACRAKQQNSQCDIALADFWGVDKIAPEIDDDKGCGLVLVNNKEKLEHVRILNCRFYAQNLVEVVKYNPCILEPVDKPINRDCFFTALNHFGFIGAFKLVSNNNVLFRLIRKMYRLL